MSEPKAERGAGVVLTTPAMARVLLYTYWRSSSAFRVRIALGHKKIAYEPAYVNLLENEQTSAAYREKNPMGHVPCLVLDGRPVVESVAIVELLEELYPEPPLYPRDPFERARVRALVETINAGTQPLQNLHVRGHLTDDTAKRIAWAQHFITRGFDAFEANMQRNAADGVTGPFAYGSTLTAADCWLVPQIYNARRYKVDVSRYPRILEAERAALATDAVRSALPENQGDAVADA